MVNAMLGGHMLGKPTWCWLLVARGALARDAQRSLAVMTQRVNETLIFWGIDSYDALRYNAVVTQCVMMKM